MNQREFCVTQSGAISSGGMYGTNITDSYGMIYNANKNSSFTLRTSSTMVHGACIQMVTSASTTFVMSRIPAGGNITLSGFLR